MEKVEASGRTVEDALNSALRQLGATLEEVEFVVLDEGQRGSFLFGRGSREARVSVERKAGGAEGESAPRDAPDTSIPRGGARRRGGRGRGQRRGGEGGGGRAASERRSGPRAMREQAEPELTEQDFFRVPGDEEEETEEAPEPAQAAPAERDRGGERRRPRSRRQEQEIEPDINAEEVDFAAQIVDDLLQILDINADIEIREPVTPGDGRGAARAVIDISGDDLGMLIGRRGETLLAFQYIVNLVMTRRYPNRGSVTIDVEHYRHRREEQIVSLAERMADRVRESGSAITLEPMSPSERRIVHLTLIDDPEVETNSVGEGLNRKVVISARE